MAPPKVTKPAPANQGSARRSATQFAEHGDLVYHFQHFNLTGFVAIVDDSANYSSVESPAMSGRLMKRSVHGHHIYAYCNVQTNQVLYTLGRRLENAALKQLPDLGANATPPQIRRDMWRRLWVARMPLTEHGAKQGLHAFKKLLEYRKLHELCWTPPEDLSRPFSELEIEKMQSKLDERGGSKKESVYDIIKRKKRKIRVQTVMDQKANSIADLAAVLQEQDDLGATTLELRAKKKETDRIEEVSNMVHLSQLHDLGLLGKLSGQVRKLHDELKKGAEGKRTKIRAKIEWMSRYIKKIKFASTAVIEAREKAQAAGVTLPSLPKPSSADTATLTSTEPEEEPSLTNPLTSEANKPLSLALTPYLPSYPSDFDPVNEFPSAPKRGWIKQELYRRNAPIFTARGVTVWWTNQLDAEYASSWPADVVHKPMTYLRNQALPKYLQPPKRIPQKSQQEKPVSNARAKMLRDLGVQSLRAIRASRVPSDLPPDAAVPKPAVAVAAQA